MASAQRPPRRFFASFGDGLKRNWQTNVLFIVLVMAVAAIVVAINSVARINDQNVQLKHLVECQNSYNTVNNTRTRLLSEASERESAASAAVDKAFEELVRDLRTKTDEELNAQSETLADKLRARSEARNKITEERLKNPVPPPPQALCGEPPK